MKGVAALVRRHLGGIVARAKASQTTGFLETLNGLLLAAQHRTRCIANFDTVRTVTFLTPGEVDFGTANRYARYPTRFSRDLFSREPLFFSERRP